MNVALVYRGVDASANNIILDYHRNLICVCGPTLINVLWTLLLRSLIYNYPAKFHCHSIGKCVMSLRF